MAPPDPNPFTTAGNSSRKRLRSSTDLMDFKTPDNSKQVFLNTTESGRKNKEEVVRNFLYNSPKKNLFEKKNEEEELIERGDNPIAETTESDQELDIDGKSDVTIPKNSDRNAKSNRQASDNHCNHPNS